MQKAADRGFTLNLRSSSNLIADLNVKLSVTFPVTYPKTTPRLHLEFGDAVRIRPTKRIRDVIELTLPKLIGSEMVFAIATEIQDILEDAFQELLKETPNLDQERANREASAEQTAEPPDICLQSEAPNFDAEREVEAQEQIVEPKEYQADQEHHPGMVLERTKRLKPESKDVDCVAFDKPTNLEGLESFQGSIAPFRKVFHRTPFGHGPITKLYTVLPDDFLEVPTNFLILKECVIKMPSSDGSQDQEATKSRQEMQKKAIHGLEDKLNQLMHAEKNEHIASVLNFRVRQMVSIGTGLSYGWSISILVERATFGSLQNVMESMKTLDIKVAKPWILDIAAGIKWLHQHGFVHGRLHPHNILFMSQSGRPMKIKLCDSHFQDYLYKANSNTRTDYNVARSTYWIANETLNSRDSEPQRATDIWDVGVLMLQMLFGLDVQRDYDSPDTLINTTNLTQPFQDLMSQIFMTDHRKRLDAFGITLHRFFVVENSVYTLQHARHLPYRTNSSSPEINRTPLRSDRYSHEAEPGQSRYAQDFEQEMKLGKGGFGAVYIARNRLENRIYAIKKIVQSSASALEPILKEVRFLSQLNHPNVVRYFTAWMESDSSGPKGTALASEHSNNESDNETRSSSQKRDTSGLDYISSSGRVDLGLGYDDDDDDNDDDDDDDDDGDEDDDDTASANVNAQAAIQFGYDEEEETASKLEIRSAQQSGTDEGNISASEESSSTVAIPRLRRTSTNQAAGKTTLYIQMEYCKNKV